MDRDDLMREGYNLKAKELDGLEQHLMICPNDFPSRLRVIGYCRKRSQSRTAAKRVLNHALWMIDTMPADSLTGQLMNEYQYDRLELDQLRSAWEQCLTRNPDIPKILFNASLLIRNLDAGQARDFLLRARELDRSNPLIGGAVAREYMLLSFSDQSRSAEFAGLAIESAIQALRTEEDPGYRMGLLTEFTPFAISFGHLQTAGQFAAELKILANADPELSVLAPAQESGCLYGAIVAFKCGERLKLEQEVADLCVILEAVDWPHKPIQRMLEFTIELAETEPNSARHLLQSLLDSCTRNDRKWCKQIRNQLNSLEARR